MFLNLLHSSLFLPYLFIILKQLLLGKINIIYSHAYLKNKKMLQINIVFTFIVFRTNICDDELNLVLLLRKKFRSILNNELIIS